MSDPAPSEQIIRLDVLDRSGPNHFRIGLWLTGIFLFSAIIYVGFVPQAMIQMKPNELGDFIAGIFGPLALLWVVLGFLQQGEELRHSRNALLLQAQELKHSVEAQRDLVGVARDQYMVETDRLRAEAEQRADQNRPKFLVRGGGASISGNRATCHLYLRNVGQSCSTVFVFSRNEQMQWGSFGYFAADSEQRVSAEFTVPFDGYSTIVEINARQIDGEIYSRSYEVVGAENVLFVAEELGKPLTAT